MTDAFSTATTGPIFTLKFFRQRLVILNSHKVVSEMLDKNMNVYAGRPVDTIMVGEL